MRQHTSFSTKQMPRELQDALVRGITMCVSDCVIAAGCTLLQQRPDVDEGFKTRGFVVPVVYHGGAYENLIVWMFEEFARNVIENTAATHVWFCVYPPPVGQFDFMVLFDTVTCGPLSMERCPLPAACRARLTELYPENR